jgi:ATP-dependent DNA helicase DinG
MSIDFEDLADELDDTPQRFDWTTSLDRLLEELVFEITGGAVADPRPGQQRLAHDVLSTMSGGGHRAGRAPTGVGKALGLNTPIPTPDGWTTMGELKVGDRIFDENGHVRSVIGAFDTQHNRPCYEVRFTDGTSIIADEDHLWGTASRSLRMRQSERRQAESDPASHMVVERVEKLTAMLNNIEAGGYMMSLVDAARFTGLNTSTIRSHRRRLGYGPLRAGETFDLRPVLRSVIDKTASRSALLTEPPPQLDIWTTKEIAATLRSSDGALNHAVPIAGALNLPDVNLPVDPYLFGAWLGDGSSGGGSITVGIADADEMVSILRPLWHGELRFSEQKRGAIMLRFAQPDDSRCPFGHADWREATHRKNRICNICSPRQGKSPERDMSGRTNIGLTEMLRQIGVLNNKHIPDAYLRAGAAQREALLQGLLDTDGSVTANGLIELSLCNERLAHDAAELIRSLGIRVSVRTGPATITETGEDGQRTRRVVGVRWRMTFKADFVAFRLTRKVDRQAPSVRPSEYRRWRYIEDVIPVPSEPVRCIAVNSPSRLFLAGEAMIPTHNTLAYLSPAAMRAVHKGERTVISTDSIALQSQLEDKDLPMVANVVARLWGRDVSFAVLKGWSNYVCPAKVASASAALDEMEAKAAETLIALPTPSTGRKSRSRKPKAPKGNVTLDGITVPIESVRRLIDWANDPDSKLERQSCPGGASDDEWAVVSVSSTDCAGSDCPMRGVCPAVKSREKAAAAEIVVVNHALIGIQAAKGIPAVVGSKKLGIFHHMVVDEAHTLPTWVRGQGSSNLSGEMIRRAANVVAKLIASAPDIENLQSSAGMSADLVDETLRKAFIKAGGKLRARSVASLEMDDDDIEAIAARVRAWVAIARGYIPDPEKLGIEDDRLRADMALKVRRAQARLDNIMDALRNLFPGVDDDSPNTAASEVVDLTGQAADTPMARWFEFDEHTGTVSAACSPVEVGGLLAGNVWVPPARFAGKFDADGNPTDEQEYELNEDGNPKIAAKQEALTVCCLSATLPYGFRRDAGVSGPIEEYESPFTDAYEGSLLYIPKVDDRPTVERLARKPLSTGDKLQFSTDEHAVWAADQIVKLVNANSGGALVLAATTTSGKRYVDALRRHTDLEVFSQWEGARNETVQAWRDLDTSVLVGTRSLMTGVDAPGATCSLVIIDRVPRSAGNPVDDARVDELRKRQELDRWTADAAIYAADAALLLEQAVGRLIRSTSDRGLVAVLDPRLAKQGYYKLGSASLDIIHRSLRRFPNRTTDFDRAIRFLNDLATTRRSAAA